MDPIMDSVENNNVTVEEHNSEEQQSLSEEGESSVRPTLSQVRKSWGFRRTTIARREFMEEVGELSHSPPLVRRGRSRRTNQTMAETRTTQRASRTARSVLDDLQWSAPSSPVSDSGKPATEASAGGNLDPSSWQDFGSAFHTAFSLLGGEDGLSMTMSDALPTTDATEAPNPPVVDETEESYDIDDMEITQPAALDSVAEGDVNDVILISSQEEDSDDMTLLQIKEQLASSGRVARGGKGGRGKARGRGRGRGKGRGKSKGRGRGRGRVEDLQSSPAVGEDVEEVMLVNPAEQQHVQEEQKELGSIPEVETSPVHMDVALSPPQQSSSDCLILDSDSDQITNETPSQFDDAPEEEKEGPKDIGDYSHISDSAGYDSNALHCICRQKPDKRFMISCDRCQGWFHGDCVGIGATQGRDIERKGQEFICPPCTTKKQSQLESELHPQPDPELDLPECLTLNSPCEERVGQEEQEAPKYTVVEEEEEEEEKERDEQTPLTKPETKPEAEMATGSTLPLCIGPGCSKQALPDSVYCGTDCILQHAAVTMKTLSVPKVPKLRGRSQRRAATATHTATRSGRTSKRLAGKVEEESEEEERIEDDGEQKAAASPIACGPSLTEAQTTSIPSSKICTASKKDSINVEAESDTASPSNQCQEEPSTDSTVLPQPAAEATPPQSCTQEKVKEPVNGGVSKQKSAQSDPSVPPTAAKSSLSTDTFPTTSSLRHHETGALMVSKTTYVIPKKQCGSQSPSSQASASASCQKPPSAPTLPNETRNLPVSPAPSAPSSRPSQPNNQVRQSIQRSLTGILFKRVCECEDLEMTESEAGKLVASIEMEMFDIFRNTDSKYMNKYRTIMFNLKDPRNKGLLYRVVHGDITPFRLVRMSQKDMQATKTPEPSVKETPEVKNAAAQVASLQKPEAVKVDLPSLNPARLDRKPESTERKLPPPAPKTKSSQPSQGSAMPDIISCMLKDTTSEHKTHLFDLKCKICTGQMLAVEEEEPAKKKPKVAVSREKREPSWRKSAGNDSPLRAPPDSPDMDSPTSSLETSSCLFIDAPALTIVESPASPIKDSPASPTLESPASPIIESPASPTPDTSKATARKRAYTPVVIPAVSTVTITRRDPRTAASRSAASSSSTSGYTNTTHKQAAPYAPFKETAASHSLKPTAKTLPKSILMKPSSTSDPRLYGTSSRAMISESSADGETAQFLGKQDILWKGFVNMLTVAKFVTKGYLVSGSAENLKADLPDTIQIGGRIMPQTVWDYVAKLKTSVTKELCVIRFHPATEEEEVAYVSLFSYFSSRGRFGVVANNSHSIKDVYLVPLSAKESIPSILQPFVGPGLEQNRPNVLLGLAVVQKVKRTGTLPQEIEEKRPKVHMSKDPMWIPKPPVLYGSDKLEIFQPYDPETPASTTPPGSPSCPGSPSDFSSSSSVTVPSLLTSIPGTPPVSTSAIAATQSISNSISENNSSTASSNKTPLQTILKSLFGSNQSDSVVNSNGNSKKTTVSAKKIPAFSQVSGSMMDPIVQQYGQKSKVKVLEEEENYLDRPYDPEEEYNPEMGYETVAQQTKEERRSDVKADDTALSGHVEDDVAYDPEDDSIFEDIQSDITVSKPSVPTQRLGPASCPTTASPSVSAQTSTPAAVMPNLPTGTVVVSAATLSEQQRMLEELNKQIEEQKRQLKEQEEALRQQREAVGMFMAHFSVSDSLMSPPQKSSPQQSSLQSGILQAESKPSESTGKTSNLTENMDNSDLNTQTIKLKDKGDIQNDKNTLPEQDETQESIEKCDKYSSAGEIEDSDVAYDPEDESLFNEIQGDVFKGGSIKTGDSLFGAGQRGSHKSTSPNSHRSRKRRSSPKRRSRRERGHNRSPSGRSQRRSPSHSRRHRDKDRHRRSERDRSRHRARDPSERQGRHRKDHTTRRHSHGHRRSPSSDRKMGCASLSPKPLRGHFSEDIGESKHALHSNTSSSPVRIKKDPDGHETECDLVESPDKELSLCSHELRNVKLEISEPPKFQELQKNSVSNLGNIVSHSSTQVNENAQQETLLKNKIESTVPLREIDPPIRDSPQSPDPEPQFVKPVSIDKSDSDMIEATGDAKTHCTTFGNQAAMPSTLCSTVRDPLSNVGVELSSGHIMVPNISSPVPHIQNRVLGDQGKHMTEQEMFMQCSELHVRQSGIQLCNTDIVGSWPVMRGSKMSSVQGVESSCVQGMNAVVKEHSPDMRQKLEPAVPCIENDRGDPLMKGPLSDMSHNSQMEGPHSRPGVMKMGLEDQFKSSQLECRILDIKGDSRGKNDESLHAEALRSEMNSQDVRDYSPSFMGSRRVQRQSRPDGSPAIEERGPQKRGFQPHGRDTGFSRMGGGQDRHFDVNTSASSSTVGRLLRADRLSPAKTNERLGPQRGQEIHSRGAGPTLDCKSHTSNMPCTGQEIPQPDVRAERTMHGLDLRESGTMHDIGKPDMKGREHFSSGQMGQEDRKIPNNTNSGWRCPGPRDIDPNMTCQMSQNKNQGPQMRDPDWNAPGTDIRNNCRGPDRRGSGSVKGESFLQDNWRLSDRREPNFESQGHDMRGPNLDRPRHDNRGPCGPDFRGKGSERRGPDMEGTEFDRRGPEGPDIMGLERRGPVMDNQGSGLRGPGSQEFVSPGLGRKDLAADRPDPSRRAPIGPHFRVSGTDMRGPPSQDNSGPWLERGGPDMIDAGPVSRGSGGPDLRGPGPERRVPGMEGPGIDRRGLEGPDFRGHGPESRCLSMEGSRFERRRSRGKEIRKAGFEGSTSVEHPRHDSRGPGDFRAPRPESRGLSMDCPRSERIGFGGPDFSEPGPDCRGSAMGGLRPDRVSGGPDFIRPDNEMRGPSMDSKSRKPDMRGPRGPDYCGPGSSRRSLSMDRAVPDRVGLESQNPGGHGSDRRGPYMRGSEPDFIRVESERTGPGMEGPEPHIRGLGGPHRRDHGTESGHPNMEGMGPGRRGPDLIEPWMERPGPVMEIPMLSRKGPVDSKMGRPGLHHAGPPIMGQGPDSRFTEDPAFREFRPDRGSPALEGPHSDRRDPHFRIMGPDRPVMGGQLPNRKGPDFRGPGCERRGPDTEGLGPDRQEQGSSSFRGGPGSVSRGPDIEGQGPDRRGQGDFRGARFRHHGPNTEGLQYDRRDDWGGSESIQEIPDIEVPGSVGTRQTFKDGRPMRQNPRGPDFRGFAPDSRGMDTGDQWSDRTGPIMESIEIERGCPDDWENYRGSSGPIQEGPDGHGREHNRQGPHEWRGPESRETKPIQERRNMIFPPSGPGDDWIGPGCRGPGPIQGDPDMVFPAPIRRGHGNDWQEPDRGGGGAFFREGRGADKRGQGYGRGRGRISGSDMQGNDDRQPDFRGNMRGPTMEGPVVHSDPDLMNSFPNRREYEIEGLDRRGSGGPDLRHPGPGNRNSNTGGPGCDGRVSEFRDLGPEMRVDMVNPGQRFEHEFRGPKIRRLDPNKSDIYSDPHLTPSDRSHGPGAHNGGNPQNQKTVKPLRHRGALLPTPTEGLIRFPNVDICAMKQKQFGHPTDGVQSKDRPWNRESRSSRGRGRGRGGPAGRMRSPAGRGDETNEHGSKNDK